MRLLIVEDDLRLANVLLRVFSEEGHQVEASETCADARVRLAGSLFDLMVLDRMLPDGDGVDLCLELRRGGSTLPILMLTALGEVRDRVYGINSGADDYLLKPFEVEELLARVNALHRRAAETQIRVGELTLDRLKRQGTLQGKPLDLAPREFELLLELAVSGKEPKRRAELLAKVWGLNFDPGTNVLEVLVSRLRDKLGEQSWMIETVRGVGYRLRGERAE